MKLVPLFIIIWTFSFPAKAEQFQGMYVGSEDEVRIYLTPEGDDNYPDAIGCETTVGKSSFLRGAIYKFRAERIYYDPDFDGGRNFNMILFAQKCDFSD